jgi:hypothetical protein
LIAPRRIPVAAGYLVLLAGINFYLCQGLFFAEYTGHTNALQGLWISMARLAGEHWFRPAWWPYQDGGMPFEHTYMPLAPAASAVLAKVGGVSAARGFFSFMGLVLCLGPVTLFFLIWRLSRAPGCAFWAGLAYSITSPARALLPESDFSPIRYWSSQRIYTSVVWDDLPHETAVCFLPLALLFLWRSFERRRPLDYVLAVLFMAITVLASVFGATALFLGVVCMLAVFPKEQLGNNLRRLIVLALLAYLLVSPFLPPSVIATIRTNQQRFVEDRWSSGSLTAFSVVLCGAVLLWHILDRWVAGRHARFFVLFAFVTVSIPTLDAYVNRHFLPQPNRYHPELEMGLALLLVPVVGWIWAKLPRNIGIAVAAFFLCVAAEQLVSLRGFVDAVTRPVDMTQRIEYRIAKWVDANLPGRRVMVPGSIAQWFNVFSVTPQLSGASFSTSLNWTQQEAMTTILTSLSPQETANAVLWLKAFGVQAVTACGLHSPEFWKGNSSTKFDALLPVLWRQEDTTIYRVPQRTASLAHVIPAAGIANRNVTGVLPIDELRKYVAALEDPTLPLTEMRWDGFRRLSIRTTARGGQVISVQTCYHPGWHARANGRSASVRRDGLGFLLFDPRCDGQCEIELEYDGGWEYKLTRCLSFLTVLGIAGYGWRARKSEKAL